MRYIIVFVAGIVIGQVGFTGVAKMLDNGVGKVKEVATEQAK